MDTLARTKVKDLLKMLFCISRIDDYGYPICLIHAAKIIKNIHDGHKAHKNYYFY